MSMCLFQESLVFFFFLYFWMSLLFCTEKKSSGTTDISIYLNSFFFWLRPVRKTDPTLASEFSFIFEALLSLGLVTNQPYRCRFVIKYGTFKFKSPASNQFQITTRPSVKCVYSMWCRSFYGHFALPLREAAVMRIYMYRLKVETVLSMVSTLLFIHLCVVSWRRRSSVMIRHPYGEELKKSRTLEGRSGSFRMSSQPLALGSAPARTRHRRTKRG